MGIFFDFSEVYKNEFVKRNSGASFYKFLDELNVDLSAFVKEMVVKENAFYVSSPNMERRLLKEINYEYYKNFFVRPKDNKYQFVGDFIISNNESYYKVKDIYINNSASMKRYEKEFSFSVSIRNDFKKAVSDLKLIRSIVNDTVNVYDYHYLDFVRDFDSYLEFEKKHFSKKLGFYKTLGFKAVDNVDGTDSFRAG